MKTIYCLVVIKVNIRLDQWYTKCKQKYMAKENPIPIPTSDTAAN